MDCTNGTSTDHCHRCPDGTEPRPPGQRRESRYSRSLVLHPATRTVANEHQTLRIQSTPRERSDRSRWHFLSVSQRPTRTYIRANRDGTRTDISLTDGIDPGVLGTALFGMEGLCWGSMRVLTTPLEHQTLRRIPPRLTSTIQSSRENLRARLSRYSRSIQTPSGNASVARHHDSHCIRCPHLRS